jgi:hypothetical protein
VKLRMGILRFARAIPMAHHPAMLLYQGQTSLIFHLCSRNLSGQSKSPDACATSFAGWANRNNIGLSSTLATRIAVLRHSTFISLCTVLTQSSSWTFEFYYSGGFKTKHLHALEHLTHRQNSDFR